MVKALPDSVWALIYSFDSTYQEHFRTVVLPDLHAKNHFWRIVQSSPPPHVPPMTHFELSWRQARALSAYWNESCPFDIPGFRPRNSFYFPEHVSDIHAIYPLLVKDRVQVYSLHNVPKKNSL
jgi:hypothetical protein